MTHDNVVWLNNVLGGTLDIGTANTENSPTPITYTYGGSTYTSYLGNYYSTYAGTDADGNGVGDTAFTSGSVLDRQLSADGPVCELRGDATATGTGCSLHLGCPDFRHRPAHRAIHRCIDRHPHLMGMGLRPMTARLIPPGRARAISMTLPAPTP